jgi:ABC-type sugar transport system ATPase subunit
MDTKPFLKMSGISKTFPGVKALDSIQLEIERGEIHALIGENGAGKSTLIKILSGVYQPDAGGEIIIDGDAVENITPLESLRKGIVVIYQDFSLFPNLSVSENIAVSMEIERGNRVISWKRMRFSASEALKRLGVNIDIDIPLGELSVAKQQLVAIARALVYEAKLIIMDEPTSALSKSEVEQLFKIMSNLKDEGISILFISHKLDELFAISDRFTVLRDGKYIGTFDEDGLDDDRLISLMVGRKIEYTIYPKNRCIKPIMRVDSLSKKGNFKDISFTLHHGEILGITGLVGAGRTELVQALYGVFPVDEGRVFIEGNPVRISSPVEAVTHGMFYVPEYRLSECLVLKKSMCDNIIITVTDKVKNAVGLLSPAKMSSLVANWIERMMIKPPFPEMPVLQLSGGNQQRVVLSKWLATNPKILLIDEPTNGIDVRAKAEIHRLLRDLAAQGLGIILISSSSPRSWPSLTEFS